MSKEYKNHTSWTKSREEYFCCLSQYKLSLFLQTVHFIKSYSYWSGVFYLWQRKYIALAISEGGNYLVFTSNRVKSANKFISLIYSSYSKPYYHFTVWRWCYTVQWASWKSREDMILASIFITSFLCFLSTQSHRSGGYIYSYFIAMKRQA